jgi:hypothetical protein
VAETKVALLVPNVATDPDTLGECLDTMPFHKPKDGREYVVDWAQHGQIHNWWAAP